MTGTQRSKSGVAAMTRREAITRISLFAGGAAMAGIIAPLIAQTANARRPNIIVILADDLGYADLGCQGCTDIATPHIDSIAKNGVRFTDGYVTCPICAPTRAGLMTGRYQQRFGFETNPGNEEYADEKFGMPRSETTLAERLKGAGYATGMVGKWHLGYKPELTPTRRGFDRFFGFLSGANNYLPADRARNPVLHGTDVVEEKEYLTDAFAREAVRFIDDMYEKPFFLYLPFNAVHAPLEASERYGERVKHIADTKRRTYAAMLTAMDDAVGRVLATLTKYRIENDTIVFFLSDNGGPTSQTTSRNTPLRGYKGQVYEGGIRVPFLMQWKGRIKPSVYREPVTALDIHATAAAAVLGGVKKEWKLDGVDIMPFITGVKRSSPHESIYWRFGSQRAMRSGNYKIRTSSSDGWELYDLSSDIGESNDIAAKNPDKVKDLSARYAAWNAALMEPLWRREDASTKRGTNDGGKRASTAERFKKIDSNGDGTITTNELPNEGLFERFDKNRDGVITRDEVQ